MNENLPGHAGKSRASVGSALERGFRLLSAHKKAFLFAYALNLSVALLLLAPFAASFQKSLGDGLYRTDMVEKIDYDWYSLAQDRGDPLLTTFSPSVTGFGPFLRNLDGLVLAKLGQLPPLLLAAGFFYIFLNSFLSAATLGSFATRPEGAPSREFFKIGGAFLGRFFRLTLVSLFSFAVLFAWIIFPLLDLVRRITDNISVDRTVFIWHVASFSVALVLLSLLNMVLDYTKIATATEDRTSIFLSFFAALTFCITYAAPAFALHLAIGALGVVWILVWVTLEQWIPQGAWFGILTAIALQQICLLGRLAFRYYFYSTQMEFFLANEQLYRSAAETGSPLTKLATAREETATS